MQPAEVEGQIVATWDFDDPAASEESFRALAGGGDGVLRVVALTQVARALGLQRKFDEATEVLDGLDADLVELGDGSDYLHAAARVAIERGRVINSAGRSIESRPRFEEAYDLAVSAGLEGLAVDALHMSAIAAEPDDALAINVRALELAETSSDPAARRWRSSLLNNLAWTRMDRSEYDDALALFQRALELRIEQGDPGLIIVARWSVARALRALERYDDALAIQLELAELDDQDGYIPEEIGESLLALDRADQAKPYFARAYELLSADEWLATNEPERLARLRERAG